MTKIRDLEVDDWWACPGEAESALGDWYGSIRDKNIEDLEDGDVCRACRQGLFPDAFVPKALERLNQNPLAGEMYEGEMLASLVGVPEQYWGNKPDARRELEVILERDRSKFDDDMLPDIERLMKLCSGPPTFPGTDAE